MDPSSSHSNLIESSKGCTQSKANINIDNININLIVQEHRFNLPRLTDNFVGRDEEMDKLSFMFFTKNIKQILICGLPGMGKSELAKQFAAKCLKDNEIERVYWINEEDDSEFRTIFRKYEANKLRGKRCLFILDYDDFPFSYGLHYRLKDYFCLITSRYKDFDYGDTLFELGPLNSTSAVDFYKISLGQFYKEEDYPLYVEITENVDCIPLFLQLTADDIRQKLRVLGEHFHFHEYVKFKVYQYLCYSDHSFYVAIEDCLSKIARYSQFEFILFVLHICSYLNPDNITIDMLINILSNVEELKIDSYNKKAYDAVEILNKMSLITVNQHKYEEIIRIHRPTQFVLRTMFMSNHAIHKKSKIRINYYKACLESLLKNDEDNYFTILQYADENFKTFKTFYNTHKGFLLTYLSNGKLFHQLLNNLIRYGCNRCIKIMLEDLSSVKQYMTRMELLHQAARYNQTDICLLLLSKYNLDVNSENEIQNTPLHVASYEWHLESATYLVENKANLDAKNKYGNTPIFELFKGAFKCSFINLDELNKIIKLLCSLPFENNLNNNGETLLHLACASLNVKFVQYLLENYKFDVNKMDYRGRTPLYAAIYASNELYKTSEKIRTMLKVLEKSGAYIGHKNITLFERSLESVYRFNLLDKLILNYPLDKFKPHFQTIIALYNVDKNMNTLLHKASLHGKLDVIKFLIEQNDFKMEKNKSGNTPLFEYVRGTYNRENISLCEVNEILKLLYCENTTNNKGENILHVAATSLNAYLIKVFITKYNMNANVQSNSGETPLHALLSTLTQDNITENLRRICETSIQLILHDASLEIKDNNKMTPIDKALCLRNDPGILIDKEKYIKEIKNICDNHKEDVKKVITNYNLLHCATANNELDILKLLLQYNNEVNNKNNEQITPLHLAALNWNKEAINILINHGADLNITNHMGRKPIHYFFLGAIKAKNLKKANEILVMLKNSNENMLMSD